MYNLKVFSFISIVLGLSLAHQVSARVTVGRRTVRKYTTTRNLQDAPTKGKTGKGKTGKGKGAKSSKAPKSAKSTKTDSVGGFCSQAYLRIYHVLKLTSKFIANSKLSSFAATFPSTKPITFKFTF